MSALGIIWSMAAAIHLALGSIQLMIWRQTQKQTRSLLFLVMTVGAAAVCILEMMMFSSNDPTRHNQLLLVDNLVIALVSISLVWFIKIYHESDSIFWPTLVTVLWSIGIMINFMLPGNLTFSEITTIQESTAPWGDSFFVAKGESNSWVWLVNITVVIIPAFIIRSAWQARKSGRAHDGWVISLGALMFYLIAGGLAGLTDSGLINIPYAVGPSFIFISFAIAWTIVRSIARASSLSREMYKAKRETEKLMRSNLLGEMVATLSHELNQPLTAILGNAQAAEKFLTQPEPDLDEIRDILSDIVRDDKRARDIIMHLRRMLRGDGPTEQSVQLEQITRELLDFMDEDLKRKSIQIQLDSEDGVPKVCGGHIAIQQVIMNLVLNAAQSIDKAHTGNRVIRIRLSQENNGAAVTVRDFGTGISEEIKEEIFKPFVTTKKGSLGMGLAICRRIIENQGGRLNVTNAEGGGARFQIWLPACTL